MAEPRALHFSRYQVSEDISPVAKHDKLEREAERRQSKARQITTFVDQLKNAPFSLEEWDSQVWSLLLEKGTVHRDGSIKFEFRNGKEIKVEAK